MWLRNIVCSVVTIAGVWAFAHYWREFGQGLGADRDFGGLGVFAAITGVLLLGVYLIARVVDARAARQRGQMD